VAGQACLGSANNRSLEYIVGTEGNDLIYPRGGWDIIDGREGVDTVMVAGTTEDFQLVQEGGVVYVDSLSAASAYSERVQLLNVELVQFNDQLVDLRGFSKEFFAAPGQSEFFDGGVGIDTLIYSSPASQHSLRKAGDFYFVEDQKTAGVQDRLKQIERIHFSDQKLALDIQGNAGSAARIVGALLGPEFVQNQVIIGIALQALDAGMPELDLVQFARTTEFFHNLAGSDSDEALIGHVFKNLTGQLIPQDILRSYQAILESSPNPGETLNSLVVSAAYSDVNGQRIGLVGLNESGLLFL